jgi:hypothetical protein
MRTSLMSAGCVGLELQYVPNLPDITNPHYRLKQLRGRRYLVICGRFKVRLIMTMKAF